MLDSTQREDFIQTSRRFHADFTQIGLRNSSGIVAESKRNLSGIQSESIYALSMPDCLKLEDFMQISRRFHTDFTQNGLRNRSGIVAESKRNLSEILAESIYALSMPDCMELKDFTQISRRFHTDLTQNGLQSQRGIVAES